MKLIFIIVVIVLGVIMLIGKIEKRKEKLKLEAHEKEMEKRFKNTLIQIPLMSDFQLSETLLEFGTTEIIYDNLVAKCGKKEADIRFSYEKYGCKNHAEKMFLFEEMKKEEQKRRQC